MHKLKLFLVPLVLLAFGFAADRLLFAPPGVGYVLLATMGLVLFAATVPDARPVAWVFLGAATLLSAFLGVRSAGWLLSLNVMAAWLLAGVGATFARGGVVGIEPLSGWVRRVGRPLLSLPQGAAALVPKVRISVAAERRLAVVTTGLVTTVVVLVFLVLLASADPVFARVIGQPFDVSVDGETAVHVTLTVVIAIAAGTVLAAARRDPVPADAGQATHHAMLEPWGWATVLGGTLAVFTLFLVVHLPTMYLHSDATLVELGMSHAEYARQGYAQMIAAAALTLILVACMWVAGGRTGRAPRFIAFALLGTNVIVLVSAFHRLTLYENEFGWTVARIVAHAGILWLAAILVVTAASLLRKDLRHVAATMVGLAVVTLLGLNAMNAEGFIAARNLQRGGDLDAAYLASLSEDAVPTIAAALPTLPTNREGERDREILIASFQTDGACATEPRPWYSANLSHEAAASAAASYC